MTEPIDFTVHQRRLPEEFMRQLRYWQDKISGNFAVIKTPACQEYLATSVPILLNPEYAEHVDELLAEKAVPKSP